MKELQLIQRLVLGLFLIGATHVLGQPTVKLEHDSSWEIGARRACTIRIAQIANLSSEDSGPLFAAIYAKPGAGYDGGSSPGTLVARAPIGSIAGNSTANNLVLTTKAKPVRPGEKFTALLIETQNGRRYTMADYVVYTSTYEFPGRQFGGVGSDDFAIGDGNLGFLGTTTLSGQRRRGDFFVERIQNRREGSASGPLRLAVYATPEPYDGSTAPAVLATRPLGMLAQGDFFHNLAGKLTLKKPGRGAFYLALVVEEDQGSGFVPVSYVNSSEPREF
jgi:hypothetical protein